MSQFSMPSEWVLSKLEELVSQSFTGLVRSAAEQGIENSYSYLKMNNISASGKFDLSDLVKVNAYEVDVEKYSLKKGDFIFNTRNSVELVGKCGVFKIDTPAPILFNNNLLKIKFLNIKPEIVAHWLNSAIGKDQLKSITSATTSVAAIYQKQLMAVDVPVIPLAEQQQIAQKLDELLAQVDTLKTRLAAIPKILKRFRQSVLAAAVGGRLTEEWRGNVKIVESASELKIRWLAERKNNFELAQLDRLSRGTIKTPRKFISPLNPDIETAEVRFPDEWELVSVSEFAECLDSQRVPVKKDQRESSNGLYPYFGANGEVDRIDEYIFDDDLVMVTEDETFYGRIKPIAYRYTGKCWVNNHAHVLRAPNKIANDFLCYTLMYYKVIPWLTGTTGRAKLGQGSLNVLPMGMPPEVEQAEIVRRVEQLFAYADQIEQRVKDAQARVNHLTQSLLAKAFRGELTAEWRAQNPELISGENSATALLQRIKVEREALAGKTKTKKPKSP